MTSPLDAFLEWHRDAPHDVLLEYLENAEDIWSRRSITVDEVYTRACSLAKVLVERGKRNDVLGLNLHLEPDLYIAFYAAWLAGQTPTVLNLAWGFDIRDKILRRLRVTNVLYTQLKPDDLPDGVNAICLEEAYEASTSELTTPFFKQPEPHFALINQSSGSTGLPKSIPVRTAMYREFCPKIANDLPKHLREAFVTAPSFSGVTAGIYLSPYARSIILFPARPALEVKSYSAQDVSDHIEQALRRGAQSISFTASLFLLADANLSPELQFGDVEIVSFGGELTSVQSLQQARYRFPNAILSIGFSSTESVQASFSCRFKPGDAITSSTELCFAPNKNIDRLVLLDEDDRVLPLKPGVSGRICVVTSASADPYITDEGDDSALDSVKDIFRPIATNRRMICFEDYGEYRPGHRIVVRGRAGRRVKVNGVFIDLGFLDRVLARHPQVSDAACFVVANAIVVLYVGHDDRSSAVPLDELNSLLRRCTKVTLNQAHQIDDMPIASSGKKDWKRLQSTAESLFSHSSFSLIADSDAPALFIASTLSSLVRQPALQKRDILLHEIGVDSITSAQLLTATKKKYPDNCLSMEDLMDDDAKPTVLSKALRSGGRGTPRRELARDDLLAEISRHASNLPILTLEPPKVPRSIILTGATGYLGSFILGQLLQEYPDAEIGCIVRSGGLARIQQALSSTNVKLPGAAVQRVVVMKGDISLPSLGLSSEDKDRLVKADLVIHNAALVHWTKSYKSLFATNVDSLLFLIQHAKNLTFVSGGGQTALDSGMEEAFVGANGYTQTKYVAEGICRKVNARIVRPGYIIGDPVCNSDDFLWRFVKACVLIGTYVSGPVEAPAMNAATVIDVANHVVRSKEALDRLWVQAHYKQFFDALTMCGYALEPVSFEEWITVLEKDVESRGPSHPLYPLMGFVRESKEDVENGMGYPRPADLPEEQLSTETLVGNIRYLSDIGWLPLPDGSYHKSPMQTSIKRSTN